MRKHDSTPKNLVIATSKSRSRLAFVMLFWSILLFGQDTQAQCILNTGKIKGAVYYDSNLNSIKDASESGLPYIQINAYNSANKLVVSALTDFAGNYVLSGLSDGEYYRIEQVKPNTYEYTYLGIQNKGEYQTSVSPACDILFGLYKPNEIVINSNPDIAVGVFNRSNNLVENAGARSIVGLKQKFLSNSTIGTMANNASTGAIYGLAWDKSKQLLFASAFVKQFTVLGPMGLGGIYSIDRNGQVVPFFNVESIGINVGSTASIEASNCDYGSLVGKVGLGNMDITDDDRFLLLTNLYNKSLLVIPTENPNSQNVIELNIPNPGCDADDYAVSAVKYYNGNVYVGVTCTAETSADAKKCSFHVYELNLVSRFFNEIFTTQYAKQYWLNKPKDSKLVSQWLTDIEFNNRGEMILGIADRKGHSYCAGYEPLTNQEGDILVAYKDNNGWHLENGGIVNGRSGSGVGHYEGPGQGEFFGEDYWIVGPSLHQEVSFGTLANGRSNEILSAVFDPRYESFAGGLHRYNTDNGKLISSIEIYNRDNSSLGKSSGLGDIEILNDPVPIEIGNFVWFDKNKNGIQDPDETGISGIKLSLYSSACQKVASTQTDQNGYYVFNNKNVDQNQDGVLDHLEYGSSYYIVLEDSRFNAAINKFIIGSDTLELSQANVVTNGLTDSYDSDALMNVPGICSNVAKYPAIKVLTGNNGQNQYNFDIGLQSPTVVVNPPVIEKIIDLALIKKLSSLGALRLNDYIEFSMDVYNQGNVDVDYYELIDYIPEQLEFIAAQNPGWISDGKNALYKSNKVLLAGTHETLTIKLRLANTQSIQSLVNVAEISAIKDKNGLDLKDKDSTPDKIKDNDKGGIVNSATDNMLTGDGINDEDDQDPAALSIYDLALILTTTKNVPVKLDEDVTFQVRICNQGTESTRDIKFINYLPSGFSLSPSDNNGWMKQNGKLYNSINDELKPGQCATKEIVLRVGEIPEGTCLTDRAEIVSYQNMAGVDVSASDVDSKADEVFGNDAGGVIGSATDNILTGNGFNDEDDEDPAQVSIADLALRKVLRPGSVLRIHNDIIYDITVFNQGCLPLKDIVITDYIPAGFELANSANGWSIQNGNAVYTISSTINPGGSVTVSIILNNSGEINIQKLDNVAEISSFKSISGEDFSSYDYDSAPDSNPMNDKGAVLGTSTDDQINDHGLVDEDDHDIATIPVVDLALQKTLLSEHRLYKSKDTVEFSIGIFNQGNQMVSTAKIVDYIDTNFDFSATINPGWNLIGTKAFYTLSEPIQAGQSKTANIKLIIKSGKNGIQIPNNAEIVNIKDELNRELVDYDSDQDDLSGNDKYDKSRIDDHGQLDEDDHDRAITNPKNFDLSLIKKVNKRVVEPGADIEWTIEITNQGTIAATEIGIVDYLPAGLIIKSNDWEFENFDGSISRYKTVLSVKNGRLQPTGLQPGETVEIHMVTSVAPNMKPGIIANGAEIYYTINDFGETDDDSVSDDIPDNDGSIKIFKDSDNSGSAGPDDPNKEDDADIAACMYLVLEHSDCSCKNNASSPGNGQFDVDLTLESRNNEIWFIKYVNGLYDPSSPNPPAAPIPFTTGSSGFILSPIAFTGTTTVYGMTGIFVSGMGFEIILENQFGDKVNIGNVRCEYSKPIVKEAQNNVCSGSTIKYSVEKREGSTYLWSLGSGGTIISDPSQSGILVNWTGASGTSHQLTVIENNSEYCVEPLTFPVTIGNVSGSISCVGNAQITLDANCQATVTARQLLVGGPYDYQSYAVMIFNKDGSLVPNATVSYAHVGKPLTAKVINTCNGNSCWTKLTVEDKLPPTIVCLNDTIDCTRMKSHLGPFIYDNCDPNPTKTLLSETIENTTCNTLYSKIVHRKYIATDASGNISKPCYSDYFLKRLDLDLIVFPDSLLIVDENALYCGKFPTDTLGRPNTSFTGVPTYNGAAIWPNTDSKYCDYTATFEDILISNNNCVKKIDRIWRFTIWYCTTFKMRVYHQIIEIRDSEAPVIMCPYNKEVFTQSAACDASVYIAPIVAFDSCNNGIHINLIYAGGIVKEFKGGFITLPLGESKIDIEAYDNCYNYSYCSFFVEVIDKAAPVVQCDKETVVSLDRFGQAWVPANVFDDGTYDNCHLKKMDARRMDNGGPCNQQSKEFADTIGFCCSDVGKLITVMFRATDESGNSNTCMVQVEVQDKTIPHVYCPHDVTIDCDYLYNPNDLSEFGKATVSDNCDVTFREVDSFYINQCREGYIDRIFIAGNQFGLDVCTQRITIINSDPFTEKNIRWPQDFDTATCYVSDLDVAKLGAIHKPIITEDHCDLVGVNYEDEVFRFISGSDACFKIIRKWRVINWCRFRDNITGDPIIYERTQIIKSFNKVKPTILTGCSDTRVEVTDTSCTGGNITLGSTASDDCTPLSDLKNQYEIDFNSDGRYEIVVPGVGSIINASGHYPLGKHRIKYSFEDKCGNKEVCEANFIIINAKQPVAYCRKGLAVGIEPMDLNGDGRLDGEFATVWAKDFDQGSYHPCKYDLTYSIGRDTSKHSVTYNCDSLGKRTVLLCVTATNGKQDCCETFIEVQDNNNVNLCGCLMRPDDITINSCTQETDPIDINSYPRFGICRCDSNKVTFNDVILTNIPNICYRIERNWNVEFTCSGANEVFSFTQRIDVTTNLQPNDIQWPSDSVVVDNCTGSKDTIDIGNTPHYCTYNGNVMAMYDDREVASLPNTRLFIRTWNVFSKCVSSQSYFFEQKILVVDPIGTKIQFPPDITVNDCKKPLLPDSLNGYPKALCGCDSISYDYKDDTIYGNAEICYLVERNWSVHIRCRPMIDTMYIGIQRITRDVNLVLSDIIWPVDTFKSYTCQINNNSNRTGKPQLIKDYCGLVTFMSMDTIVPGATCNTVKRTWIAKNACSASQQFKKDQFLISYNQGSISITCPPNLTVNADPNTCGAQVSLGIPNVSSPCDFGITIMNNAPSLYPVGKTNVVFTAKDSCNHVATCTTMVTVIENVPPTIKCPNDTAVECNVNTLNLNQFGTATATDNCPGVSLKDSVIRNQDVCGIGNIKRYFIATDASGNKSSCLQTVTINNSDPLDSLEINWPPSPILVNECAPFGPNNTGVPTINPGAASCFKISISSKDSAFCVPGLCEVDRKWTVYDTCSNNTFMFVQKIIRNDTTPPNILGLKDTTILSTDTTCSGFVSLKAFVDNCDSNVITIINDSKFGGNGKEDASGFYPAGVTTVTFTATDGCCNMSMKTVKITVQDSVKPEITCKKVVKKISDNGCAVYNANEFVVIKTDNCSPSEKIMASFDPNDFNDTIRTICCDSIKGGQFTEIVIVYFKDEAGNINFCQTLLQAIDEDRICGNFTNVVVNGLVTTRKDKGLINVPVNLVGNNKNLNTLTNYGGYYVFNDIVPGASYKLYPELDVDYLEGVTTYDIVLIQQHILGKKAFVNPYQWIAADVNKSRSVTTADISEIRKLILGATEKFRNNKSWRFLRSDYNFVDIDNPLYDDWPEEAIFPALQDNTLVSFKGIKIGDIDDSQKYNGIQGSLHNRTGELASLLVQDERLKQGAQQTITLKLRDWDKFAGAQAALFIDPAVARITAVNVSEFGNAILPEQLGLEEMENGVIKFAWTPDLKATDWKIEIALQVWKNSESIDAISLLNDRMNAEAYSRKSLEKMDIEIRSENADKFKARELKLYQNIPNPFSQMTRIPFEISYDSEVSLEIFDVNSKPVFHKTAYYKKGYHEIEISKFNLQSEGLYYYQIQTPTEHINKRMLMID